MLYKIDPTISDEFTEVMELPRVHKNLSEHSVDAVCPIAVSRFSHFITVHVDHFYECARKIPFRILFRGRGTGSIKDGKLLFRNFRCFKHIKSRQYREWGWPKIDLNELAAFGAMGVIYEEPDKKLIPGEDTNMQIVKTEENRIHDPEDESLVFRRQFLRLKHYNEGHLAGDIKMDKYIPRRGEKNVTVVEDEMCIRPATKSAVLEDDGNDRFRCNVCLKGFELLSTLALHKQNCGNQVGGNGQKEKDDELIKCQVCGRWYFALGKKIHDEFECAEEYVCDECGELFQFRSTREWHKQNDCMARKKAEKDADPDPEKKDADPDKTESEGDAKEGADPDPEKKDADPDKTEGCRS